MRRRLPPLNALRAFEAAARHMSFSRAADELLVTHGAVSRQVKALEEHLDIRLFRRLHRRVELTQAGRMLAAKVQGAFDLMEISATDVVARFRPGPIVVSCISTLAMRWLIPRLVGFNARHPDIDVRLSGAETPVPFPRDDIDVSIRSGTGPWPGDIESVVIMREDVGPVLSPTLLSDRRLSSVADLAGFTLLQAATRPTVWDDWLSAVGGGLDINIGKSFETFYFALHAAASGFGVAIGPRMLVGDDIASGRLVAPFGFAPSGFSIWALYPRTRVGDPQIHAFVDWLVAEGVAFISESGDADRR